jgi:hypothetical protein
METHRAGDKPPLAFGNGKLAAINPTALVAGIALQHHSLKNTGDLSFFKKEHGRYDGVGPW